MRVDRGDGLLSAATLESGGSVIEMGDSVVLVIRDHDFQLAQLVSAKLFVHGSIRSLIFVANVTFEQRRSKRGIVRVARIEFATGITEGRTLGARFAVDKGRSLEGWWPVCVVSSEATRAFGLDLDSLGW